MRVCVMGMVVMAGGVHTDGLVCARVCVRLRQSYVSYLVPSRAHRIL